MVSVMIRVAFENTATTRVFTSATGDLTPQQWINALARIERVAHELAVNTAGVAGLTPVDVGRLMADAQAAALSENLPTHVLVFEEAHG